MKKKSIVLVLFLSLLTGCAKNPPPESNVDVTAPVNAVVSETDTPPETSSETKSPSQNPTDSETLTEVVTESPLETESIDPDNLQPPTLPPEVLEGMEEESWEYIPYDKTVVNDDGTIQLTLANMCTLTLPKNWADQFKVTAGQQKDSYVICAVNNDDAELFEVYGTDAENITGRERAILGTYAGGIVALNCPQDSLTDDNYLELVADIGDIIQNARGMTSEEFKPIDTLQEGFFAFPSALGVEASELIRGTWAVNTSMWTQQSITSMEFGQNSVYVIFTAEGKCAYRFFPEQEEGYYLLNTSITSTDSYNEKPYALCYFGGHLHRVLIYQMAMQIEEMPSISKTANAFEGGEYVSNVWDFYQYSQSQSLSMDSMLDN